MDVSVKMDVEPSSGGAAHDEAMPPLQPAPQQSPPWGTQAPLPPPAAGAGVKKHKPIPPPLDLRMPTSLPLCPPRTAIPVISPSSPYHQKNLPFRKRAFSFSHLASEEAAGSEGPALLEPESPCAPSPLQAGLGVRLSSGPLIQLDVPSRSVPCTPQRPLLTPTGLLSPAPSHVSSSAGSSQEEIRADRFLFPPAGAPVSPHAWHASVWHTFMAGTRISFHLSEPYWVPVEEVARRDGSAAPYGLLVAAVHTDVAGLEYDRCILHLQAVYTAQPDFLAACLMQQPFFVQNHGWSSLSPDQTFEQYSVPCRELRQGDVCLITSGPLQSPRPATLLPVPMAHTPPGSPAARAPVPLRPAPPPPPSPAATASAASAAAAAAAGVDKPVKPKRPMNGFMLFAKKYRVELINQHPGKDNRAISVMLGETWKALPQEEREHFTQQARVLAEEKKRMYPDCWKRKRSVSAN